MRRIRSVEAAAAIVAACLVPLFAAGCSDGKQAPPPVEASQPAAPPPPDPAAVHANEAGVVPILAFRDIIPGAQAGGGNITAADFKKDLEWLDANNYHPVSLLDLIACKVDCPAGKMPVVLTFDDGLPGQFRVGSSGSTDPNCGLAILEAFNSDHPEFPLVGTFFVSPNEAMDEMVFGSKSAADYKMERLTGDGFEIGCAVPSSASSMSTKALTTLLANGTNAIKTKSRSSKDFVLSVPVGGYPKQIDVLKSGTVQVATKEMVGMTHGAPPPHGKPEFHMVDHPVRYSAAGVVTGGDTPSASPASPKFDPFHIARIAVSSGRSVESALKSIKDPFVSDGDPATIAVPETDKADVSDKRLGADIKLKTYPAK